jgi:hypothetical protein
MRQLIDKLKNIRKFGLDNNGTPYEMNNAPFILAEDLKKIINDFEIGIDTETDEPIVSTWETYNAPGVCCFCGSLQCEQQCVK